MQNEFFLYRDVLGIGGQAGIRDLQLRIFEPYRPKSKYTTLGTTTNRIRLKIQHEEAHLFYIFPAKSTISNSPNTKQNG